MRLRNLLLAIALLMLGACTAKQQVQTSHNVETVTVEHTVDTVYVALPQENLQAVVPADSVSKLQTATAESTARLTPDGHIEHRLYSRDTVITVPVPTIVTTRAEQTDTQQSRTPANAPMFPTVALLAAVIVAFILLRRSCK